VPKIIDINEQNPGTPKAPPEKFPNILERIDRRRAEILAEKAEDLAAQQEAEKVAHELLSDSGIEPPDDDSAEVARLTNIIKDLAKEVLSKEDARTQGKALVALFGFKGKVKGLRKMSRIDFWTYELGIHYEWAKTLMRTVMHPNVTNPANWDYLPKTASGLAIVAKMTVPQCNAGIADGSIYPTVPRYDLNECLSRGKPRLQRLRKERALVLSFVLPEDFDDLEPIKQAAWEMGCKVGALSRLVSKGKKDAISPDSARPVMWALQEEQEFRAPKEEE